jgi:hypothetical protein
MTDNRFAAFQDGFESQGLTEHQDGFESQGLTDQERTHTRALVDYTTNTFRIYVPASDSVELGVVHALNSREEFLHGEWQVALVNTCARLRLAGIDALYTALGQPTTQATQIDLLTETWAVANAVDSVVAPFQEAVDKLQMLSVVDGDEQFIDDLSEQFAEHADDDLAGLDFKERLTSEIEDQRDLARGAKVSGTFENGELYVNPLYYHALLAAAGVDEAKELSTEARTIAETVARVTLDVPFPIAPLGDGERADGLAVADETVPPVTLNDLQTRSGQAARYAVDDELIERYLLAHIDRIGHEQLRNRLGTSVDEYDVTWLDAVFVTTLQALESLRAETDESLGAEEDDTAEDDTSITDSLRRELSRRVHGVDPHETVTMLHQPTPLLELPQAIDVPDQDLINVPGGPLPKVLLESFGQHGSFAAVVFEPSEGQYKRQLNYYAIEQEDVSVADHPEVPDGIDSFAHLWEYYFVGKELANALFNRHEDYRQHLIGCFCEAYDDPDTLSAAISSVEDPIRTSLPASRKPGTRPPTTPGVAAATRASQAADSPSGESLEDRFPEFADSVRNDPYIPDSTVDEATRQMQSTLDRWQALALREAAELLDVSVTPLDELPFDPVVCPLCVFRDGSCGVEACTTEGQRDRLDTQLPAVLEQVSQTLYRLELS